MGYYTDFKLTLTDTETGDEIVLNLKFIRKLGKLS
jgi:hypothetical protein